MKNELLNDWSSTKTYATEANLWAALAKLQLHKCNGILVVLVPGTQRYTAVFGMSFLDAANIPLGAVAHCGFKVFG